MFLDVIGQLGCMRCRKSLPYVAYENDGYATMQALSHFSYHYTNEHLCHSALVLRAGESGSRHPLIRTKM